MKKLAFILTVFLSVASTAATHYVDCSVSATGDGTKENPFKTIAEGVAAASDGGVVLVGAGTYSLEEEIPVDKEGNVVDKKNGIVVDKGIHIKPDPDKPGVVTVDGNKTYRVFNVNHTNAFIEGLHIYQGWAPMNGNGGGVFLGKSGGTVTNCLIESCAANGNNNSFGGGGAYIQSGGLVTGCEFRNCEVKVNSKSLGAAVYVDGGTLERSLVRGSVRTLYADTKLSLGAVYHNSGLVDRCTIVDNSLSDGALYVCDNEKAVVRDTIVWGNSSWNGKGPGYPNVVIGEKASVSGLCTTGEFGDNPLTAHPSFVDAANGDYRLSPASACIGKGTDGCDIGYSDYNPSVAPFGIKVSAYRGNDLLPVELSLVAADASSVTSVEWVGLGKTGNVITHDFEPGIHTVTAKVTLADGTCQTVSLNDAIEVRCTKAMYVDASSSSPVSPYTNQVSAAKTLDDAFAIAGEGAVIYIAEGEYEFKTVSPCILDGVKLIGTGAKEKTIISKAKGTGRFFYINNADAAVCNLTMTGAQAFGFAGGLWISGSGGTVSNCTVTACKTGASQNGGGVWLDSPSAVLTHSLVSCNTAGDRAKAAGVLLNKGTVSDCLVISNKVSLLASSSALGGGIYMGMSTPDAKVINCTIADNSAYSGGGIYRTINAGYVYNTICFNNSSYVEDGTEDVAAVSGTTRPVDSSFVNCCTSKSIGQNCQVAASVPYQMPSYELTGALSSLCIDKGDNGYVISGVDYVGNSRIFNGAVDIGAFEYSETFVSVGFTVDTLEVAGSHEFIFEATALGLDLDSYDCTWFITGSGEVIGEGKVFKPTLLPGRYRIKLLVSDSAGASYTYETQDDYITVYPSDVYVDNKSTNPVWPFSTWQTAATNVNEAVDTALFEGGTLHIAEGDYPVTNTLNITARERVVGAGMDKTCLFADRNRRVLYMNGVDAYVDSVCVSNGYGQGGGVFVNGGATFTRGRVVDCLGAINQIGGGVYLTGDNSKVSNSDIVGNRTYYIEGDSDESKSLINHSGGGVALTGRSILENCLVRGNKARSAAGVLATDESTVRNCTVVSNMAMNSVRSWEGGGGIVARLNARIVNCISWDNLDMSESAPDSLVHNFAGQDGKVYNCCIPVEVGESPVAENPCFKDSSKGDYRLTPQSPCVKAGLYEEWMNTATDFFGLPRATSRNRCDIGFSQLLMSPFRVIIR